MRKCIYNGKIINQNKIITNKAIIFDKHILEYIDEKQVQNLDIEKIDAKGDYISPGFIDIHMHGINGDDISDGIRGAIERINKHLPRYGVTSYLPTTMTMSNTDTKKILEIIKEIIDSNTKGAQILGVHMEGPFINIKRKGAQPEQYISKPQKDLILKYQDIISLMTLAPEVEGVYEFIKYIKENTNIKLSIGHTDASFEEAMKGIGLGIISSTHTFNAMSSLHHRDPGAVGASLVSDIYCELIADGIHIHPGIFNLMLKTKGIDRLILVTDCIRAGGLVDGKYTLAGQTVFVEQGKCTLSDGTIAGSTLTMNTALKIFRENTDEELYNIIKLVTKNPATLLGVEKCKGSIDIGKDADIVVFDENIDIKLTLGRGEIIYER